MHILVSCMRRTVGGAIAARLLSSKLFWFALNCYVARKITVITTNKLLLQAELQLFDEEGLIGLGDFKLFTSSFELWWNS